MSEGRLLIVSKDSDLIRMLRIFFGNRGCEVRSVICTDEMNSLTSDLLPDVVVVDDEDATPEQETYFRACELQDGLAHFKNIEVIFLIPKLKRSSLIYEPPLGTKEPRYLTKPFDPYELTTQIESAFRDQFKRIRFALSATNRLIVISNDDELVNELNAYCLEAKYDFTKRRNGIVC